MRITPFYTTVENGYGLYIVRFVEPPDWTVREFAGNYRGFSDPGEAIQEFKKYERHQQSGYLTKTAFERRIMHHKQDLQKLDCFTRQTEVQG